MKILSLSRFQNGLAGVLIAVFAMPAGFAAIGQPVAPEVRGAIQSIDYVHHAITVNGQRYTVAADAGFTGIDGFAVLHIGMPIAYTLSSPAGEPMPGSASDEPPVSGPPVIIHITWLPD